MKAESIEKVIEYLEKQGVKVKYEQLDGKLNRIIEFEIGGNVYFIEWWINQSYLKFENKFSVASMPFKFIKINPNSPTTKHSHQLCFYDVKQQGEKDAMFYFEIPFGAFRIPINLAKK